MIQEHVTTTIWRSRHEWLAAAVLAPIFALIYYGAFWLRFEGQMGNGSAELYMATVPTVVLIKLLVFRSFSIYQVCGRYVTFDDLLMLFQAAVSSTLLIALADYFLVGQRVIPRSVSVMDWGATIVVVGGFWAVQRLFRERDRLRLFAPDRTGALIVGADDAGESLLRAIHSNRKLNYQVVGFVDDDPRKVGTRIGGIPVLGTLDETSELADRYAVHEVLISAQTLSGKQVRKLVEDGEQHGVRVNVVPRYEELLKGTVAVESRPVAIEDLLRREPVRLDMEEICQWIDGRVVMVTGSAGSIGSEICRQLATLSPARIVLVDRAENGQFFLERELKDLAPQQPLEVYVADTTDAARMESIFKRSRPDIVFHAAAYKHVPLMEANPGEAVKNIVLGTRVVADLADQSGTLAFVMISTDKAVNPTSVMGACKRVAELYVQALAEASACRFVTVRFGNVLDSAGSVIPIFRDQISHGGPVTITHPEMVRYFMTIPEASQLVIQAGAMGKGGEIFVLDMGEPVRIVDLAGDMIRLSGLRAGEDIEINYIGLRPGERLCEKLYHDGERHLRTTHPKIMVAESPRRELIEILPGIYRLASVMEEPKSRIVAQLRAIVPDFGDPSPARPARRQSVAA